VFPFFLAIFLNLILIVICAKKASIELIFYALASVIFWRSYRLLIVRLSKVVKKGPKNGCDL
jgi:hypothetical protein